MNLYYEMPGEAGLLTEGRLLTEDGEPIEGIMVTDVLRHGPHDSVTLVFTMMVEKVPRMERNDLLKAVKGITDLHESLAE